MIVALIMFTETALAVSTNPIQKELNDLRAQLLQASQTTEIKGKAKDISENQKKLFKVLQKQAGSEIQIFDTNQPNVEEWRENLVDMRLNAIAADVNLKKNFVPPVKPATVKPALAEKASAKK